MISPQVSKIYDDKTVLRLYNNTYQKEMQYPIIDIADFAFILAFFVVPSLFSNGTGSVTIPDAEHIPWMTVAVYSVLVIYMMVRYHSTKHDSMQKDNVSGKPSQGFVSKAANFITRGVVSTFLTFIYLCLANYIISRLALTFGGMSSIPAIQVAATSFKDKIFLLFWTILLASFEEFTYRWLLPTRLLSLWALRRPEDAYTTTRKILCEIAVICLFALSHRYMGWWAVLNALIAGVILRTRFFISGSVYPAFIAHTLYNLTAFYGILKP